MSTSHRRNAARLVALTLILGVVAAAGCRKPLFSPRDERTQFDRYDRSRNQYAPQFVEDEYGRQEPNLKGRLSTKD